MEKGAFVRLPLRFFVVLGSLLLLLTVLFTGDQPTSAGPGGPGADSHFKQQANYRYCDTPYPGGANRLNFLKTSTVAGDVPGSLCVAETNAADTPYDTSISFDLAWGDMNFGGLVALTPPHTQLTASVGGGMPIGAVVGRLRSATTLGLVNAACNPIGQELGTIEVNFNFLNATTDINATISPIPIANAGTKGAQETMRNDLNGNGIPNYAELYPSYLNKVFDPDRIGDVNGDGDELDTIAEAAGAGTGEAAIGVDLNADTDITDAADLNGDGDGGTGGDSVVENGPEAPLRPYARYSGNSMVAGTAVQLDFVTFEPGQLQAFPSPHPFSDFGPEMGWPSVTVLQDPTQPPSPSAITDFCSPLATYTVIFGVSRDNPCTPAAPTAPPAVAGLNTPNDGIGCVADNTQCSEPLTGCATDGQLNEDMSVCSNEVDDDGDGAANDGCVGVGVPEAGAACNDNGGVSGADSDNDSDRFVDDGCPVVGGTAEPLCATCSGGVASGVPGLFKGGFITVDPTGCDADTNEASCNRVKNPLAGTGIHGSGTQMVLNTGQSIRDLDGDGFENTFDTCKSQVNVDDGRVSTGADADMIDPVCDPDDVGGTGNVDSDCAGTPTCLDWANAQDSCPLFPNETQRQSDNILPRLRTTPYGGPGGDDIGDACEGAESGAECEGANSANDDAAFDGRVNDGCPKVGTYSEGAYSCNNALDEADEDPGGPVTDDDTTVNDGCPIAGGFAENDACNNAFDGEPDGTVNDGCPLVGAFPESGIAGACADAIDEPDEDPSGNVETDDLVVNDGCPAVGASEFGITEALACTNATNDEFIGYDTIPNDGCPTVGTFPETFLECDDAVDAADEDPGAGVANDDTVVNDGCNTFDNANKFVINNGHYHAHIEQQAKCIGATDTDGDGYCDSLELELGSDESDGVAQPGGTLLYQSPRECDTCGYGIEGLGQCALAVNDDADPATEINDGCPTVGPVAEAGLECDNATDDEDNDVVTGGTQLDGVVNDGCAASGPAETSGQCGANAVDNDGDGGINDGCPLSGGAREVDAAPADCQNGADDDGDGQVNDGCWALGHGNCADGIDNDGDTVADGADAGCKTPEDHTLEYPLPLGDLGAGTDADGDGVPDNDEPSATPDNDATNTAAGQQEEPHQVCGNDIDEDGDTMMDAFNNANNGTGAQPITTVDPNCSSHVSDDADRDGLSDASDNCGATEAPPNGAFNPSQKNTGGAAAGDACDADDDGDGTTDLDEWKCGSRSLSAASEVSPPCPFASTLLNPTILNAKGPLGAELDSMDRDGDGWTLAQELLLGTETVNAVVDDDPCGNNGWPGDLDPDNGINIGDINSFTAPPHIDIHGGFNKFGHPLDDTVPFGVSIDAAMARWNLDLPPHTPTEIINIGDLNAINPGVSATSSRPPMFGLRPAFFEPNSGRCPFAP